MTTAADRTVKLYRIEDGILTVTDVRAADVPFMKMGEWAAMAEYTPDGIEVTVIHGDPDRRHDATWKLTDVIRGHMEEP